MNAHAPAPPPGAETTVLVASIALLITLCSYVVRRDERRLERRGEDERLARAWPDTSRDAALIGLSFLLSPLAGLFGVVYHFFRTRRWHPLGLGLGLLWAAGIFLVYAVVVTGLAYLVGYDVD